MERFGILSLALAVAAITAVCSPAAAQTDQGSSSAKPEKVRQIPSVVRPTPFLPGSGAVGSASAIEFRTAEQMTGKDRAREADAESSIGEKAGYADLGFNEGKWSYRQLVCPALPNHLFLRFTRNNGTGDVSVFSASIPLKDEGRVRIIPIERRGYSLFSPAPVNKLTISAFNHIRAEEGADSAPGWLGTALCYAALAGANPQIQTFQETPGNGHSQPAQTAIMYLPQRRGAVIQLTDAGALPRPMTWTMTFDRKGTLVKAAHEPAEMIRSKDIPAGQHEAQGKPTSASAAKPGIRHTAEAHEPQGRQIPASAPNAGIQRTAETVAGRVP